MAPKYIQIAEALRKAIWDGVFQSSQLLPTELQLSQQYGASRQTVRQALSLLVSEGLIEKRQGSGSRITQRAQTAGHCTYRIAIITTYISDYIFPSLLRSIQEVFSRHNCTMQLSATQNQVPLERQILEGLLLQPVDGIIVEGTKTALPNPNVDLYLRLQEKGIPVVFLNTCYAALPDAISVLDDNFGGGYQLVDYLVSRGHQKIAGIFKSDDIQGVERYSGYITALRDNGILQARAPVAWFTTENRNLILNRDFPKSLEDSTAVVCYNDEVAYILMSLLEDAGISVPQQMAVVSFDNSSFSELCTTKITSLSHGEQNTGLLAAEKLLQLLNHDPVQSEVVPWSLEEKASS